MKQPSPATIKFMKENKAQLDVIIERIQNLKELVEANHNENSSEHCHIENQVMTTNGRVKRLELWKMFLMGAWAVISIFVIPMLVYFIFEMKGEVKTLSNKISEDISKAIYENNVKQFEEFNQ